MRTKSFMRKGKAYTKVQAHLLLCISIIALRQKKCIKYILKKKFCRNSDVISDV